MLEPVKNRLRCDRRQKTGTKEWAESNVNICYGCKNNCRYCYAKKMAIRFGRTTEQFWSKMVINQKAVEKKYTRRHGTVMFPSTHDITSEILESCVFVLKKLLEAGNAVLITTKPELRCVQEMCHTFKAYKKQILFRFTIGSINNKILKFWEPNAPLFEERFESLKFASSLAYATSVSIEPFLDYNPIPLVEKIYPFVSDTIWIGKMNYIKAKGIKPNNINYYKAIRKNYEFSNISKIIQSLNCKKKIKWKDSINKILDLVNLN